MNLWGFDGDEFFSIRKDEISPDKPILKPAVKEWIWQLQEAASGTPYMVDVLDLIGNRMLDPDTRTRIRATELVQELELLHKTHDQQDSSVARTTEQSVDREAFSENSLSLQQTFEPENALFREEVTTRNRKPNAMGLIASSTTANQIKDSKVDRLPRKSSTQGRKTSPLSMFNLHAPRFLITSIASFFTFSLPLFVDKILLYLPNLSQEPPVPSGMVRIRWKCVGCLLKGIISFYRKANYCK